LIRTIRRLLLAAFVLLLLAAAVIAGAFFADHPGHVEIVWENWEAKTSVTVLLGAVVLVAVLAATLALLAAVLHRMPRNFRRRRAARRRRAGDAALTRGLVALAAGQTAEAMRHARRAETLLDRAPIPLLLIAEAATRQGDANAARESYTRLLERKETEFLALRGLIAQALRGGDDDAALRHAERARHLRPEAPWLSETLLVLEARAGDWAAARATLAGAARRGGLLAERARHHEGVVLHELSCAAEQRGELRQAVKMAARAQQRTPDLAAPAVHHARLLIALGRRRAAARVVERAWRTLPHPDLAHLYLEITPDAGPLARAAAVQRLAAKNPQAIESHIAIAEAALTAQLWGEARRHLNAAVAPPSEAPATEASPVQPSRPGPSRRLCRLMARLEESEGGDASAAREWLRRAIGAPADPTYVCTRCGGDSSEWQAQCAQCDGFDTLVWRSPPAGGAVGSTLPAGVGPAGVGAALILPSPGSPPDAPAAGGAAR
jgi:HemY protein